MKRSPDKRSDIRGLPVQSAEGLDAQFTAKATPMPRARLGAGSWQFEDDKLARLRDKIVKARRMG
ncbi:MAG: hypothetical protein ABSD08_19585 [Xanthobacteraceae bacterium]|jgi:hypothetical protein